MTDQAPAQDANEPEQEDRGDIGPFTLDTLPRKIISMILATMTVDPKEPYELDRSTLEPSATREEQDASARRDLASLCLVSKWMASQVRPALYRNILIRNSDTLVYLYRTFLEKPQFGMLVKRMTLDHGFSSHLTVEREVDITQFYEIVVEKLYTLQFRVLSHTSRLEFLDFNVQPLSRDTAQVYVLRHSIYMEVIGRVFLSLWDETSPYLASVKELQLLGRETPHSSIDRPNHYAAWVCRRFLTLPKLNRLVWFNHDRGWFDTFPRRMLYGKA
ncbi:hypothetical protein KVR01_004626 [Diaporthe batatas]|uniref:uncharacterized protein n=1 Tax=Diaporthe batatas TaxID=748121 RepID=UPI001D03AB78|nr:uncharacterized protein KVR01_004626 [Diaporthe batatas]KAG8166074.1 hypothetical protein KVR01_004626 [Diaporthe batatas]